MPGRPEAEIDQGMMNCAPTTNGLMTTAIILGPSTTADDLVTASSASFLYVISCAVETLVILSAELATVVLSSVPAMKKIRYLLE